MAPAAHNLTCDPSAYRGKAVRLGHTTEAAPALPSCGSARLRLASTGRGLPTAAAAIALLVFHVPGVVGALVEAAGTSVPEGGVGVPDEAACIMLVPDVLHRVLVEVAGNRVQAVRPLVVRGLLEWLVEDVRIVVECPREAPGLRLAAAVVVPLGIALVIVHGDRRTAPCVLGTSGRPCRSGLGGCVRCRCGRPQTSAHGAGRQAPPGQPSHGGHSGRGRRCRCRGGSWRRPAAGRVSLVLPRSSSGQGGAPLAK
mmetsp:Transcript_16137/g.50356  ORF Transcript_16137/g.50356 Transcript_16137/m.50356 type:complete len:255 (-) Transcript_16137:614-1378(-)